MSTVLNDLSHNGMIDEAFPELFCRKRGVTGLSQVHHGSQSSVHSYTQSTVPD